MTKRQVRARAHARARTHLHVYGISLSAILKSVLNNFRTLHIWSYSIFFPNLIFHYFNILLATTFFSCAIFFFYILCTFCAILVWSILFYWIVTYLVVHIILFKRVSHSLFHSILHLVSISLHATFFFRCICHSTLFNTPNTILFNFSLNMVQSSCSSILLSVPFASAKIMNVHRLISRISSSEKWFTIKAHLSMWAIFNELTSVYLTLMRKNRKCINID